MRRGHQRIAKATALRNGAQAATGSAVDEATRLLTSTARTTQTHLWALATMKLQQPELVRKLCWEAWSKAADFNSKNTSNTLRALATVKLRRTALVHQLCWEAWSKAADFNSQNISNTLWSLATKKTAATSARPSALLKRKENED